VFKILNAGGQNIAAVALFVHFIYHPAPARYITEFRHA